MHHQHPIPIAAAAVVQQHAIIPNIQPSSAVPLTQTARVESMYAVPQRMDYNKPDLKAVLVEKYSEPQYQNVPNDYLLRRKSSVDANTMTNWQQNGLPVGS